jgi:thiamine-monophosphate kinase
VATTDVLVEGVHFSDRTTSPEDVGWRAVAANLSDLAAMGADPIGITVGLSLPGTVMVDWVEAVYRGMEACLDTYGGVLLGGDLVRSPQVSLAVTALGQGNPQHLLYRDRAQVGDMLLATGLHGASRAGLAVLLNPAAAASVPEPHRTAWVAAHQRPRPRFDGVQALRSQLPAAPWPPIAAMDTSDGLANAVLHLTQASGVGATLVRSRLPIPAGLADWVGPDQALDWTLYGGEDFELVLTLPPELALDLLPQLGPTAALIGTVEPAEAGVVLLDTPNAPRDRAQPLPGSRAFQHFGPPES